MRCVARALCTRRSAGKTGLFATFYAPPSYYPQLYCVAYLARAPAEYTRSRYASMARLFDRFEPDRVF